MSPRLALAADVAPEIAEADSIIVPVQPSVIDMEASTEFLASLATSERERRKKTAVGLIGNRSKPWTTASANATAQIATWPYPLVTTLRDSQAYVLLAGLGKSLFHFNPQRCATLRKTGARC